MRTLDPTTDPGRRQALAEHLTVMRAQLGERDAMLGLFERYNVRLLYYLRRVVSPPGDAEDVLQDVWLTVIKKIATLEQPEAFKGWIYRIAHNRAISRGRSRRDDSPLEELTDQELAGNTEEMAESAFFGFDPADVHDGIGRLSPPHREVLTLRFLEELTYEEIADVVGTSLGTVRSRLHYAKRALHEDLASRSRWRRAASGRTIEQQENTP
jgi:RNA polymerase sigma-70 factor (ECF subfamily)